MKRLTLASFLAVVLVTAPAVHADGCGHQHAERCLTAAPSKQVKTEFPVLKTIILRSLPKLHWFPTGIFL
ncbi:MAG: hypothetical protein DWQ47_04480 [Acidobacteria bacterium]|nr:MAG: hypothetical protein DWQ32_08030 [Acidobacteriota bacterium]REK01649.1 MAG: hypothetical protein DWQ38_04465 [Acidobacteriota bacterium]REK14605.1 MAG: hypothetical protein DWQ43_13720 [Acidobacteriota bacterium]REK45320.1 MAG: hypothetical protein DWQ47_04480 [Acidobacteriota bacterium]